MLTLVSMNRDAFLPYLSEEGRGWQQSLRLAQARGQPLTLFTQLLSRGLVGNCASGVGGSRKNWSDVRNAVIPEDAFLSWPSEDLTESSRGSSGVAASGDHRLCGWPR